MQVIGSVEIRSASPTLAVVAPESPNPDAEIHRLRALRRKARRISAYARLSVEALTALTMDVESDLAALRH